MRYQELDGTIHEEETFQDKLLKTLYTTFWGRVILKPLVAPWFSKLSGRFLDSRLSSWIIKPFIRRNHIDMSPYQKKTYRSYNEFFTREIRKSRRAIDDRQEVLVSPCDGKVSVYPLDDHACFSVKNTMYSTKQLLESEKLARRFLGGYAVVIRLSVEDYHHYCYPASGYRSNSYYIPGKFHTVNPIAVETVPVYKQNAREYTLLKTKEFGTILQMEVGALMVGKICNLSGEGKVKKGQEKGYFEFGGSTVILLLQKDKVVLREQFLRNTKKGIETKIQMGQELGKSQ
ncbi:MAG: archaetidylserine decarboxylase [Lachnospiraceae bacterium]|nr:archaetidylserine decarboxylase [Robinsoniella sp.]MDY3767103.1 archaetidylserine decarboxylase [Lachnospiraceae bacterium]